MRWGGGVGDTASMDRSKLLLSDDLLLELETKVREVLTLSRVPIHGKKQTWERCHKNS